MDFGEGFLMGVDLKLDFDLVTVWMDFLFFADLWLGMKIGVVLIGWMIFFGVLGGGSFFLGKFGIMGN